MWELKTCVDMATIKPVTSKLLEYDVSQGNKGNFWTKKTKQTLCNKALY